MQLQWEKDVVWNKLKMLKKDGEKRPLRPEGGDEWMHSLFKLYGSNRAHSWNISRRLNGSQQGGNLRSHFMFELSKIFEYFILTQLHKQYILLNVGGFTLFLLVCLVTNLLRLQRDITLTSTNFKLILAQNVLKLEMNVFFNFSHLLH